MNIKRIAGRTIAIIILAIIVLIGGAWVLVHTPPVNRFLLAKITQKAESSLGSTVRIGSMSLTWTRLGVNLHDVVIFGRSGPAQPPFFSVHRAAAQIDFLPLFRQKFHLAFISLDQPVIHFLVDENGDSNMPHPPSKNPNSSTMRTLLNLEVRKFTLQSGELDLRDQKIPLSAELHDLRSKIGVDAADQAYSGSLQYRQGTISSDTLAPVQHSLQASFTLTDSAFDLHPLSIHFGGSYLSAEGQLTDFSSPHIDGRYSADVLTNDIADALHKSLPVSGKLATAGKFVYHHTPGATVMDTLEVTGDFRSKALAIQYRQVASNMRSLQGYYSLERGNLHVWKVAAQALGGSLSANLEMAHVASHPLSHMNINLRGASLSTLDQFAKTQIRSMQRIRLLGVTNISVSAVASSMRDFQAHALVEIRNPSHQLPRGAEIPLAGRIDLSYDAARDLATFRPSSLQIGATQFALAGTVSSNAQLNVRATTTDLHQLSAFAIGVARRFRPSESNTRTSATSASLYGLNGALQFTGAVSGHVRSPRVKGRLAAQNLQVDGTSWHSLQVRLALNSSQAAFHNGILENGPHNQITFDGQVGLQQWSLTARSKIQLRGSMQGISLAEVGRVAGKHYPISGFLAANVNVSGSQSKLNGAGHFQITKASLWNQQIKSLGGNLQFAGRSIGVTVKAQMPAGNISAKLAYAFNTKIYQASVRTPGLNLGQIQLAKLQKFGVSGTIKGSASGHGTLQRPSATAMFQVVNFQVRGQSISQAQAHFELNGRQATFSITASKAQTQARLAGNIELSGRYPIHATLDVPSLAIGPLLASYFPSAGQVRGQTALHATANGPLKNIAALNAQVDVPKFSIAYQSVHLELARPLKVDYADGIATVNPTELTGTGTDLKIQGRIPVKNSGTPASLAINGAVNLAALQSFGPSVQSSGRIEINIAAKGRMRALASGMQGQIRVVNASFFTASSPVGLENWNAVFQLTGERIDIRQFQAQIGGGTLSAQGSIGFGKATSFNLSFQGNRMRILYPQGIRSVLTANLQFNGTTAASQLSGQVRLDELSFTQQFDVATLMTGFSGSSGISSASPFMQHMKLNVSLQSTRELQLASSQVSMAGSANLNVIGTAVDPVILGRVALTGGDIFFMGKRYQVQSGTISFANPVQTEPVVNMYVETTVRQYDITLNFVGPIQRLRTNYTSVPPLSPSDIINLLAFGKTTEEAAAAGSTPASVGAESVLAQSVGSQISGKLQNLTGLSQLTISPTAGSNQSGPGAQIAVQEQVTGSLLLTFSTDVTATQDTAVQLQYSAAKHLTVSVLRDQNGGYAVDIRVRKSF
jgi:autotransporter translocation and assembly factor TamB